MPKKSIAAVLSDRKSRDRFLTEALAASGGDLFDFIPTHRLDGSSRDPNKGFARSDSAPKTKEIHYGKSSPEMIIEGRVVLKDGRRVYWK